MMNMGTKKDSECYGVKCQPEGVMDRPYHETDQLITSTFINVMLEELLTTTEM